MAQCTWPASHPRPQAVWFAEGFRNSGAIEQRGAIKIGLRLGAPKFYDYIPRVRLWPAHGCGYPGVKAENATAPGDLVSGFDGRFRWGQEIGVTPIQLISAVSAIANGGMLYRPHVIAEFRRGEQVLPAEGMLAPAEPRRVDFGRKRQRTLRRVWRRDFEWTGPLGGLMAGRQPKNRFRAKIDPATGRYSATQLIAPLLDSRR